VEITCDGPSWNLVVGRGNVGRPDDGGVLEQNGWTDAGNKFGWVFGDPKLALIAQYGDRFAEYMDSSLLRGTLPLVLEQANLGGFGWVDLVEFSIVQK